MLGDARGEVTGTPQTSGIPSTRAPGREQLRPIGFFPKRPTPAAEGYHLPGVSEIASVSQCIAQGPLGWVERWAHNEFGLYDREALALETAGNSSREYRLYGYASFPLRWGSTGLEPAVLPPAAAPIPADYRFLGYDIVTRSAGSSFECSPLSCNGAARDFRVNQFCLIDGLAEAWAALEAIGRAGNYEPGPYYLVAVWRKPGEVEALTEGSVDHD